MRRVALGLALSLVAGACAREPSSAPSLARRPVLSLVAPPGGALLAQYDARWDAHAGELFVEGRLAAGAGGDFTVDAHDYVSAAEAAPDRDGASYMPVTWSGDMFLAKPCAEGPCRIRYRYRLRTAAKRIDDIDTAMMEDEVVLAPPSTWLLVPRAAPDAKIRFRVSVPDGQTFVTGIYPSREAPGAWDITLDDLATAPYSAFGVFRTRTLAFQEGSVQVAVGPGKLLLSDERLAAWVTASAHAIEAYFGRFPMPHAAVLLVPANGRWIGEARTLGGGGGSIFIRVGEGVNEQAVTTDWVMVHEMVHLAFPSLPQGHRWAEEGGATYVEPFARVRAGTLSEDEAWLGLLEGLPNGQPGAGDRGLDRTPTWGRTYWGGALFYFLADIEIRKRTKNAKGLEHAFRAIVEAGGTDAVRWPIETAFSVGDRATGTQVLMELYREHGSKARTVDLAALEAELGVSIVKGRIRYDDRAPLAAVRRAIATGK